jgi:tape measure domain-containing protein
MSTTVDQRVVEMRFDNKQFENNIQTSLSSIDKLKKSLNMDGATKGLESVEKASGKINLSGLSNAVETVNAKFSALEVMAITALANITNSAVNAGKSIVSALTIDPIKTGFQEYETQINAVQTILANTSSKGTTLDQVNNALDELNRYSDKTIYNFTEMTRNIGTFTAAGVDLDTSVSAIKGIANLAAVSGSNSQQASTAMYQLSQALAAGTVKLQDWNSVVNAGMGGQVFQDALKETARVHGIAIDDMIKDEGSFRETLQKGWLTSDILTETLSKFTGDLNEEQLRTMGYSEEQIASIIKMGQTANDAATKVKTFSQLFDTLKEAAQSGWTQSWEIIVGNFDEAKELLTEMSNTFSAIINSSADARNSMLQGWKDLGGRTALIEAARNAFEGVLSIIKPVKEAFREIFPPMTAQQLYNITDALKNLTAHLKLSDTNSENLKRTFKGLFAVIDIVKQAFVAVAKGVGSLLGGTGDLAGSILSVTARFGDWLVKLDETIKKTDIFNIAIQTVIKCIKTGVAVATDLIDKAVDAVTRFANAIKQKYDTGGFAVIHSRMSEVGEAADGMRSGVEIAIGAMGKALENSKFLQVLQALWDGVKTIGTGIAKAMKTLASGFVEDISDINFSSVFDVLSGISLAGIAVGINKFLKGITDAVSDVTKLTDQIKGILDSVRGCFEAYQTQLKAGTLIKIASAIAILTGAIVVLSLIDSAKLASAITALTGLFAELMASMAIFTKISGDLKKATKTVTIMLGLSVSVLILASALKKIASLSWNEIAKGITGITVISGVLAGVAKVISKDEKTIAKGAFNLIFLATAVKILASACKDISQLSWGELGKGLTGVGVLMAEIALFLNTAKFSGKAVSTATGILVLSAAIKVLASACKDFGSMQWSEIGKGLTSIGILLAEIATFTNLTGNAKHVISTGIALIAIAGAMKIMASACKDFGSMQWDEIGRGLTVMAGALAEITLAVNLMPKNMVSTGVGLIAVAGALTILSNVLSTMGNFTWEEIGKGLVTMGGALAELSIALNLMNGTLAGSAALLIASASLAVLAPVLSILGAMSWEAIAKGLVSLAGAFAIIGVAGAVLSPIIPSILALAGAFALIGVGVTATGAGLLAAGLGLQALAIGFTAVAAAGTAGATALVAALAVIITGVADLIPAVLVKLAEGITQFCVALAGAAPQILESLAIIITACLMAISNVVPQLVEVLVTLLVTTLQTLAEHTPEIVQAVFDILIACLQGIADNIGMVVQTAIDIVLNFIDGIAQKLPDVIQSGVNLLLSFIEGITSAIDNNSARLANDIRNLFLALLRAAVLVLTGGIVDIKAVGSKIMNSGLIQGIKDKLSHLKETVRDLISNAKQVIEDKIDSFKSIGKHLISGFIGGIKDKASDLANSALSAVKGAVNGVKSFLGIHSPSKLFAQFGRYTDEGFINGVKAYAGKVSDATVDMGKGAVGAMSDTLSTIADLVDSDIDSEPTIRPVMDLSNIQNGANQLFSMMKSVDGYSLSGSLDIANRTGSRINEVRSKATDNSSVLDKISDAVGNFNGGNSFENTFNITGSNPKEIAEEVSNIIQRQVERRDASWA